MDNKFYAIDDTLLTYHVEGCIEITEEQYNKAVANKMSGLRAFVRDDELVLHSGNKVKTWDKKTRQITEIDDQDIIPDTHTDLEPDGDVEFSEDLGKWVERVKSAQELAYIEHSWVTSELNKISVELMYHWTEDPRATHTEEAWKQYARDLRNYTTTDEAGIPSVIGDSRPTIGE